MERLQTESNGHHTSSMLPTPDTQNSAETSPGQWSQGQGQAPLVQQQYQQQPQVQQTFWTLFMQQWPMTITYCAMFWSFGMCVAFLGPTLLDLGCLTSSDMKSMSWVFMAQLLFSLIGTSVAGYLVRRIDANWILLVNTIIIPVCMFCIPFCTVLGTLGLTLAVMGFNMGFIDCLANLQLINLYGVNVAPFLHALHFCYGFGAFVSPMIVEPFLLNEDCSSFVDDPLGNVWNETDGPAHNLTEAQDMTRVPYAFWIMSAVLAPIPVLVLVMVYRNKSKAQPYAVQGQPDLDNDLDVSKSETPLDMTSSNRGGANGNDYGTLFQQQQQQKQQQQQQHSNNIPPPERLQSTIPSDRKALFKSPRNQLLVIVGCTAGLLFIYDGLQSSYGGYIYSYALISIVDLNKTEGAYLNAIFWGMFALGRLLSIPLATRFSPAFMLLMNIIGCTMALLLILVMSHNHTVLYVGTCVFGLFLSSVVPTAISLAELYIDINSSITSILIVVGALGEMVSPVIVGNLFVSSGPLSFIVFCNILCFFSIATFTFLWIVGRTTPKFLVHQDVSFIWCRMCAIRKDVGLPAQTVQHVKYLRKHASQSSNIEMNLVGYPQPDQQIPPPAPLPPSYYAVGQYGD